MSILRNILPCTGVLTVAFSDGENYGLRLVLYRDTKHGRTAVQVIEARDIHSIRKELSSMPVIVLTTGYGVISKPVDSAVEIVDKVTAQGSGFLWSINGNEISFIRREQFKPVEDLLLQAKARVVTVQCVTFAKREYEENPVQMIAEYAGRYYAESVNLRMAFKPSFAGSELACLIASKLRLPVLGIILLALAVNTVLRPDMQVRHENAAMELQALQKTIGKDSDAMQQRQELIREYSHTLPYHISWLCDRIAMVLPEGIILSSLCVQPLMRTLEHHKKVVIAHRRIEISGEASGSLQVSEYISALHKLGIASQVSLASMEQNGENGLFNFKITIEL